MGKHNTMKIYDKKKDKYKMVRKPIPPKSKPYKCSCELGMMQPTTREDLFFERDGQEIKVKQAPVFICDVCERLEYDDLVQKNLDRLVAAAHRKGSSEVVYQERRINLD